jgi:hypothetical protein
VGKLTDGKSGTIAKAEAPAKGQKFIFDDHRDAPRGLGLRLTAAGGKAFVFNVERGRSMPSRSKIWLWR